MATEVATTEQPTAPPSAKDQTLLLLAGLMEGGQEDDDTCKNLDKLTKLLNDDAEAQQAADTSKAAHESICSVIDGDCIDTLAGYLDMRQADAVRGHATLTISAYLKAAGESGRTTLSTFFYQRVQRGAYDDCIVAFCVAAAIFPIVPELSAELFLNEGFLSSLGALMRRKWKSRKVETACLEMLNAACMHTQCREAIEKYCLEWLEEIVDQDITDVVSKMSVDPELAGEDGSAVLRKHSEQVQHLAAVILAKLKAAPSRPQPADKRQSRVENAVSTIEDLSNMFIENIMRDEDNDKYHSVEGLAYSTLQSNVKETVAEKPELLKKLVDILSEAQPKSPTTYGALSIFVNLTRYQPALTEEEKKMSQLKAYANAAGKLPGSDPLNDDDHVSTRCKAVFDSGITPVMVTHSKEGSPASVALSLAVIHSLAVTKALRGQLAQQGAISFLLFSWSSLPDTDTVSRGVAAQAMARILISINPAHIFGGNRATSLKVAIPPLVSIIPPDPAAETRDLLPTFEGLMALTNLASLEDSDTRHMIIRSAWSHVEEQLLSSNRLVARAAVELVCNLMQSPEGIALYADDSPQSKNRLHILLALADAEDEGTRSAAGGALANLTAYPSVVRAIMHRDGGTKVIMDMCVDGNENLRHRGVYAVLNMISDEGEAGDMARKQIKDQGGVETLKECLKKSRRPEVLQVTVQALKTLLEQK